MEREGVGEREEVSNLVFYAQSTITGRLEKERKRRGGGGELEKEREGKGVDKEAEGVGGAGERELKLETLFYKDGSLGSAET